MRVLAVLTAALYLFVLTLVTWTGIITVHINDQADSDTHVLCALRDNITQRRDDTINFLNKNPKGVPGIPATILQRSINEESQTLEALRGLSCPH